MADPAVPAALPDRAASCPFRNALAIPPYAPFLEWINGLPHPALHLNNYAFLFTDPLYISAYLYSLKVAAVSTLFCLLLGYPMAYVIARAAGTGAVCC